MMPSDHLSSGEASGGSAPYSDVQREIERLWEARWLNHDAILKLRDDYEPLRLRLKRVEACALGMFFVAVGLALAVMLLR